MPTKRPISDLHNYDEVLQDVKNGEPVFFTQNGKPRYVILDIEEYEKINATLRLMSELEKGERSARENGWIDFAEIEREFSSDTKE
jgi:prevent-host-death family protein